jgi:hypothetical protein
VGTRLTTALKGIRGAVPFARIVLVGYPRLLPAQQAQNTACGWLTPRERIRANTLATYLDVALRKAAKNAGVDYVSVLDVLDKHELCTADSWVFEVNPLLYGRDTRQGHPIYPGQAAIRDAVRPYLRAP